MANDVYSALRGMEALDGPSAATRALAEILDLCATVRKNGSGLVAASLIHQTIMDIYQEECDIDASEGFRTGHHR